MIYLLYAILGAILSFLEIGILGSSLIVLIVLAIDISSKINANYYD